MAKVFFFGNIFGEFFLLENIFGENIFGNNILFEKNFEKIFIEKYFWPDIFDENIFGKNIFFLPFPNLTALQTSPTSSQLLISDF